MSSIQFYTECIKNNKLLTAKEEVELSKLATDGDKQARDRLVNSNMRLVISIARNYSAYGHDIDDLIQEGTMGLMKAIDKFDPSMGYRLSTYATWWIRQTISRHIYDKCKTIRLPVHINEKIGKIKSYIYSYKKTHSSSPSIKDIVKATKMSEEDIRNLIILNKPTQSIDETPNGENDDIILLDMLTNSEDISDEVFIRDIGRVTDNAIKNLSVREEKVLRLKYGKAFSE